MQLTITLKIKKFNIMEAIIIILCVIVIIFGIVNLKRLAENEDLEIENRQLRKIIEKLKKENENLLKNIKKLCER